MPATSVVIPCYNVKQYLPGALATVRAQTRPVHEVVVVDDGSIEPVRLPSMRDGPPAKLIRTPNRGIAAARNLGARASTGRFVAFLDSDDEWLPAKVERQEDALEAAPDAAACYTRAIDLETRLPVNGEEPPSPQSEPDFFRRLWRTCFFLPSSIMTRREALDRAGGFDERIAYTEDWELWFRLARVGRFVGVDEPLLLYRRHPQQVTRDYMKKVSCEAHTFQSVVARHGDFLEAMGIPRPAQRAFVRDRVLFTYFQRRFDLARGLLWRDYARHPSDLRVLFYAIVALFPASWVRWLRGAGKLPPRAASGSRS